MFVCVPLTSTHMYQTKVKEYVTMYYIYVCVLWEPINSSKSIIGKQSVSPPSHVNKLIFLICDGP